MENQLFYMKDEYGNYKPYKMVPADEPTTESDAQNTKVAFVIGHYSEDKGANSSFLDSSEYTFWKDFYDAQLKTLGDVFLHSDNSSYTQRQEETAEKTKDYDLVFELHFNASESISANGVEALVYFSNELTKKVGQFYCDTMAEDMHYKNRNVKAVTSGNGYRFLQKTKGDAILLEPFFGSNEADCSLFNPEQYKEVIKKTITKYTILKKS